MFLTILLIGIFLVLVQGFLAWQDGYFTQAQMQAHGVATGYSFMEHGGMWSDVFIISPLVAYLVTRYRFAYTAWWSWLILVIAVAATVPANMAYNKIGLRFPVAHNHDGHITRTGWIHVLFGIAVMWIVLMFYFTPLHPPASAHDIVGVSLILTPFFFLGMVDFNRRWVFLKEAKITLAISILSLWAITIARLLVRLS